MSKYRHMYTHMHTYTRRDNMLQRYTQSVTT